MKFRTFAVFLLITALYGCSVGVHYQYRPATREVDRFYINDNLECIIVMSGHYKMFNIEAMLSQQGYDSPDGPDYPVLYFGGFVEGTPPEEVTKSYTEVEINEAYVSTERYRQPWPTFDDKKPVVQDEEFSLYNMNMYSRNRLFKYLLNAKQPVFGGKRFVYIYVGSELAGQKTFLRPPLSIN